ncbi:glycoside hydrolase family 72 protein [Cantharellus anzutake]|uniref:glycoside hydrolase family 72 protein n=1 Tax=Cantharellus anzutake TaxID=1750568 RepID=UPI00190807E1|nr:glycoside hydrolase family 72 protein [Cantharellus anzutake]KAF8344164.1 glycoside hydrolase family 72 protein [Cantharellus anzutake]
MLLGAALGAALLLAGSCHALQSVNRVGRYLYGADDGKRFYVKGISYQEQGLITGNDPTSFPEPGDFIDPLADSAGCQRDLPYLQQLGVNTIRVYSVNSSLNHDTCMSLLSKAGIYTIIDLSLPVNGSLDRVSPSWTTNLLNLYVETIEAFSKYDNVLAYNVGNEVAISNLTTVVGPFIKAAARDVKGTAYVALGLLLIKLGIFTLAYLKSKKFPQLVGYASVDAPDIWRLPFAQFLSCDNEATSIDIYGLNNYEWCGDSNFQAAYVGTENAFKTYNIPAYFSEFGCVKSPPRLWTEVQALFGPQMIDVWSGGLAFSYFPAFGGFGMVNISSDAKTVIVSDDFNRLKSQYALVNFTDNPTKSNAGTTNYSQCPAETPNFLASTKLPDTPNTNLCDCVLKSFSCLFTPQTPNYTYIVGDLLNYGCSQLGSLGGSCDTIASNGETGVYGSLAECDPTIKLSYVLSSYYEAYNRTPQSCNFSGNATINPSAPPTRTDAVKAAQSCLTATPASTFTPSSVPLPQPPGASTSSSISTSTRKGGATNNRVGLAGSEGIIGLGAFTLTSIIAGVWILL